MIKKYLFCVGFSVICTISYASDNHLFTCPSDKKWKECFLKVKNIKKIDNEMLKAFVQDDMYARSNAGENFDEKSFDTEFERIYFLIKPECRDKFSKKLIKSYNGGKIKPFIGFLRCMGTVLYKMNSCAIDCNLGYYSSTAELKKKLNEDMDNAINKYIPRDTSTSLSPKKFKKYIKMYCTSDPLPKLTTKICSRLDLKNKGTSCLKKKE